MSGLNRFEQSVPSKNSPSEGKRWDTFAFTEMRRHHCGNVHGGSLDEGSRSSTGCEAGCASYNESGAPQPFLDGSVKRCDRRKRIGSSSSPRLKERLRTGFEAAGMDCHRSLGCLRMAW